MKKGFKSISVLLLIILMLGTLIACDKKEGAPGDNIPNDTGSSNENIYKDGVYQGAGTGNGGEILLEVEIKKPKY